MSDDCKGPGRLVLVIDRNRCEAFVIDPDACHACGLCVTACPERAIRLQAV